VFYGKPNPSEEPKDVEPGKETVWLGDLAHLTGGFKSRSVLAPSATRGNAEFRIPAVDLTSHLLIAGTTGSGKTQRAAALLNELPKNRFQVIVIESAKKTYRNLLRRRGVSNRILALGANGPTALRINPFYFEPRTSLKRHISIFSDALADLLPVEALIGPKLREAIQRCYIRYEWDIETGTFRGTGEPAYPNMVDLHMEVIAVADALKYGPELNSNYKGALLGRSRLFIDELYQDIFGWGGSLSLDKLLGDHDIILEMDALPPSEAKMPSFVLSLLLERMRSWQQASKADNGNTKRDLVIVIEEAHNLLEKSLERQQSDREMGSGGFLLKQIVRLLQEGRESGMGIIVVDQSPASLADAVIRNTNTKIILRITDSEEAERIGSTLGLTKEECRDLHDLEDGEAVVKVKNAGKALKLCPAEIVEKNQALASSEGAIAEDPDYYRAAKSLREIGDLDGLKREAAEALYSSAKALLSAAGENNEAKRFFAQKLIATICEAQTKPSSVTIVQAPTAAELALRSLGLLGWKSVECLKAQILCLLKRTEWRAAKAVFGPDSLPLLPMVVAHLKSDIHWAALEALADLQTHFHNAVTLPDSDPCREDSYSFLLLLANASEARFHTLQVLMLQLNP
jgi:tetratricopeptide (TPR) repeat protein